MAASGFLFRGVNNGGAMNLLAGEARVKNKMIIIFFFSVYITFTLYTKQLYCTIILKNINIRKIVKTTIIECVNK